MIDAPSPLNGSDLETMKMLFGVLIRRLHKKIVAQWSNLDCVVNKRILDDFWKCTFNNTNKEYCKWLRKLKEKTNNCDKYEPSIALECFNNIITKNVCKRLTMIVEPYIKRNSNKKVSLRDIRIKKEESLRRRSMQSNNNNSSTETPGGIDEEKRENGTNLARGECCICLSNCANVAVVPCGHVCMCQECSDSYDKENACPICRKKIQIVVPLIVSGVEMA